MLRSISNLVYIAIVIGFSVHYMLESGFAMSLGAK
jgi:hypothetical protein